MGFPMGVEERGPGEIRAAGIEIVTRVDNVVAACDALTTDGVRFAAPPDDTPWGVRQA
jgi:uncharacterized glyoxalase superfamily protein PhnB